MDGFCFVRSCTWITLFFWRQKQREDTRIFAEMILKRNQSSVLTYRLVLQAQSQNHCRQASSLLSIVPPGYRDSTIMPSSAPYALPPEKGKSDKLSTYLPITPLHPPNPISQLFLLWTHDVTFHRRHHSLIVQQNRTAILVPPWIILSLAIHEPGHSFRHPERYDDLIDEVGSKVVDGSAAGGGGCFPGRGGREGGAMPVEVCFEGGDAAEGTVFE